MLVTYATYTVIMKRELTGASNIVIESRCLSGHIFSFQDLLQYYSVCYVEDAATTLDIPN